MWKYICLFHLNIYLPIYVFLIHFILRVAGCCDPGGVNSEREIIPEMQDRDTRQCSCGGKIFNQEKISYSGIPSSS